MRDSEDFSETVRRGRKAGRTNVVVHVHPSSARGDAAIVGFVVSRAVGSAVQRNRVKRRLRHLMAQRLDQLPPRARVVVRALPPSAGVVSAELGAELDVALHRACAV